MYPLIFKAVRTVSIHIGLEGPEAVLKEAMRYQVFINGKQIGSSGQRIVQYAGLAGSEARVYLKQFGFEFPDTLSLLLQKDLLA